MDFLERTAGCIMNIDSSELLPEDGIAWVLDLAILLQITGREQQTEKLKVCKTHAFLIPTCSKIASKIMENQHNTSYEKRALSNTGRNHKTGICSSHRQE
jgi:TorA maturation chaperone TorD